MKNIKIQTLNDNSSYNVGQNNEILRKKRMKKNEKIGKTRLYLMYER